ncbi:DUF4013 domain-containing protein [Candidatus Woesearchaeota archaeon]|nr:DUF4013 domain-containing protein [Candidatus Woesearchaeota archaeon]
MVNYSAAFRLPFTNWRRFGALFLISLFANFGDWANKDTLQALGVYFGPAAVLLGLGILMLAALFSAALFSGYMVRVANGAARGKNEMPPFDDFSSLFAQGLKYIAGIVLYALPFVLIVGIVAFLGAARMNAALSAIVIAAAVFGVFMLAYIWPLAMVHFAFEKKFSAFFDFGRIFKYAFKGAYFVPWLVALAYSIGISIPFIVLGLIIGFSPLLSPYVLLLVVLLDAFLATILSPSVTSIYGQAYRDVTGVKGTAVHALPAALAVAKPKAHRKAAKKKPKK